MFKTNSFRALAITLALAPMIGSACLQAYPRGLVRSSDFSQIYWIDRFGVSHSVSDTGTIPIYFKGYVIKEISWDEWMKIPKGGPISMGTPPEFYDTSATRITLRAAGLPETFNARTTTSYRTIATGLAALPVVETKTVTTNAPVVSSTKVIQTIVAPPAASGILDVRDELAATSTIVEKRVELSAPVATQRQETFTRGSVVQRQTEVVTPQVTQTRVEQLPSTALLEKRTVTTVAAVVPEQTRTVTTVTQPAEAQRTVTTVTQPAETQRTVTTVTADPAFHGRLNFEVPQTTELHTNFLSSTEDIQAMPQ